MNLPAAAGLLRRRRNDPWRKPLPLSALTWGYVAFSIVPILIAVAFSFNAGRSRSVWQGFSFRWWVGSRAAAESLLYDTSLRTAMMQSVRLSLLAVIIAVPLGVLFAIGVDRWRGRVANVGNVIVLLSFVVPEIILGVSLFLTVTFLLRNMIHVGTVAQVIGLTTLQIPYPFIIVRARLLSIPKEYEEAAMDLGGRPTDAIRRVLLPLLYPAIFVGAVLVFANSIDDFVTVRYLSGPASSEPLSVKIYNAARASPSPSVNAAASFMLFATLIVTVLGVVVYRRIARGHRGELAAPVIGLRT
jgi:spermidine/putrescine transport system permease protein